MLLGEVVGLWFYVAIDEGNHSFMVSGSIRFYFGHPNTHVFTMRYNPVWTWVVKEMQTIMQNY